MTEPDVFGGNNIKNLKNKYKFLNFEEIEKIHQALDHRVLIMMDKANYTIIDALEVSVYWKDQEGVYLGCNQYMLNMNGFSSRDEIIGKMDQDCVWKEHASIIQKTDHVVMQENRVIRLEEPAIILTGELRFFATVKRPLHDETGKVVGIIGVSTDITEYKKNLEEKISAQKLTEQERSYRQAVSVYSGSMSHDLKNPLLTSSLANEMNKIFLQKIQEKYKISPQDLVPMYQKMDIIQENHEKMREMIDSSNQLIQDISSDHPQLIQQEFSAYSLIKESLSNYFEDTQSGLIQFEMPVDFRLSTNKITFFRIMFNLIDNAKRQIKLKNQGQIFISTSEDKEYFLIKIKDTAGGVTSDLVANIFDLYKNKQVQGTGLGLQAVSKLMENQKGFIQVQFAEPEYIEFILGFKK